MPLENVESNRIEQPAGYLLIEDNPIICAGIFPYLGKQLPDAAEPERIYNVYRPLEELTKPETLESFKGLPITDEHAMLGDRYGVAPEQKGVHGAILDSIKVIGNNILAPISIFSTSLKSLIDAGKKGLSLGYNCVFNKVIGEYEGIRYDYIQRDIRGNHLALVTQGRNGTVVLDSAVMDEFDLNIKEFTKMAEENNKKDMGTKDKEDGAEGMTLEKVHGFMKDNAPMWHELQSMMSGESDDKKSALDADTKEKEGDQAEDKEKDCEDESDSEKKSVKEQEKAEDKKSAMDTAIKEHIALAIADFKKTAVKSINAAISTRDALAKRLTPHIGTFACDTMDVSEVAAYGAKKLGITGGVDAVNAYLAAAEKFKNSTTFAMDSAFSGKPKAGGKLSATLEKASS